MEEPIKELIKELSADFEKNLNDYRKKLEILEKLSLDRKKLLLKIVDTTVIRSEEEQTLYSKFLLEYKDDLKQVMKDSLSNKEYTKIE